MSYSYRGRYTHDYAEYQRWMSEGSADETRRANEALRAEAERLQSQLSAAEQRNVQDVREVARRQTRLEETQREQETLVKRIEHRQEEFEKQTERRRAALERDLRSEIGASETRVTDQLRDLQQTTEREIASVRIETQNVRNEMRTGIATLTTELNATRVALDRRIDDVRSELESERNLRIQKQQSRADEAAAAATWIESKLSQLSDLDALGLTVEKTRTLQQIERIRERLRGPDGEMAAPIAETAIASYQTAYFESERRLGVIDGVAEHVERALQSVDEIVQQQYFASVFAPETEQLRQASEEVKRTAEAWLSGRRWHSFENERFDMVGRANRLLSIALELRAVLEPLMQRLAEREDRLQEVIGLVESVTGPVDAVETSYANPKDPKSPRLLRARLGAAHIDIYLDLDGTYNIDAYGFPSSVSCAGMAERMGQALQSRLQIADRHLSADNRQTPSITPPAHAEAWRARAEELAQLAPSRTP